MCRLYGFHANEPTKVECSLVYAQNALLTQSQADLRGTTHADGWGIAFYRNGEPEVEKRDTAAYEDIVFSTTAERVYSKMVVAHVRKATVGVNAAENTHPFIHGPWTFAHNGTVTGFDEVGPRLAGETLPELQALRLGTTDSEQVFYWLLTRLAGAGVDLSTGILDLDTMICVLARAVLRLADLCRVHGDPDETKLNLLLTNGKLMVVSRWHRDLHWVERENVHDCEICGIPHVQHERGKVYRSAVIASEPLSDESWQEVPDYHVLAVNGDVRTSILSIRDAEKILGAP